MSEIIPDAVPQQDGLAAALAVFQAKLPEIRKGDKATIKTKTGAPFTYSYADLADVSKVVLPLLGEAGLSFTAQPTLTDSRFVLAYTLMHVSGEQLTGQWPLPDPARSSAQEIGIAITYGRRYCLLATTGVHPYGEDDDAATVMGKAAGGRYGEGNPFDDDGPSKKAEQMRATPQDDQWQLPRPLAPPRAGPGTKDVPLPDEDQKPHITDLDWLKRMTDECATFTGKDTYERLWRGVNEKVSADGCTRDDGSMLKAVLRARWTELTPAQTAGARSVPEQFAGPAEESGDVDAGWPEGSEGQAAQSQKTGAKR